MSEQSRKLFEKEHQELVSYAQRVGVGLNEILMPHINVNTNSDTYYTLQPLIELYQDTLSGKKHFSRASILTMAPNRKIYYADEYTEAVRKDFRYSQGYHVWSYRVFAREKPMPDVIPSRQLRVFTAWVGDENGEADDKNRPDTVIKRLKNIAAGQSVLVQQIRESFISIGTRERDEAIKHTLQLAQNIKDITIALTHLKLETIVQNPNNPKEYPTTDISSLWLNQTLGGKVNLSVQCHMSHCHEAPITIDITDHPRRGLLSHLDEKIDHAHQIYSGAAVNLHKRGIFK